MIIQITVQELMIIVVCVFVVVAVMLLLPILWDLKKVVGILRPMLETNQESIKKTIKLMPEIVENARHISKNVRETTEDFKISAPLILKEVESSSNSAKESIEMAGAIIEKLSFGKNRVTYNEDGNGFMSYLYIFEEVLQIVYRTFSSNK
jgi:predicted Holliday junction resolvase-like endonuclease